MCIFFFLLALLYDFSYAKNAFVAGAEGAYSIPLHSLIGHTSHVFGKYVMPIVHDFHLFDCGKVRKNHFGKSMVTLLCSVSSFIVHYGVLHYSCCIVFFLFLYSLFYLSLTLVYSLLCLFETEVLVLSRLKYKVEL